MDAVKKDDGHYARKLTTEEVEKLAKDTRLVSEFQRNKLENEARKNWDLFYKRNSTHFFKDRHWTTREFQELTGIDDLTYNKSQTLLEIGCGVGNFIFPLIEERLNFFIYACDFSKRAIQFVKENPLYDSSTCCAFECDITSDNLTNTVPADSVDIATMIFVLSAINPTKMLLALKNVHKVIKPGGFLLFRDYGLYDQAMLRFTPGHKLEDYFYVRQDGTRAYYFSEDFLSNLLVSAGFEVNNIGYVKRKTVNKKEGISVDRVFLQAKFTKPEANTINERKTVHSIT